MDLVSWIKQERGFYTPKLIYEDGINYNNFSNVATTIIQISTHTDKINPIYLFKKNNPKVNIIINA